MNFFKKKNGGTGVCKRGEFVKTKKDMKGSQCTTDCEYCTTLRILDIENLILKLGSTAAVKFGTTLLKFDRILVKFDRCSAKYGRTLVKFHITLIKFNRCLVKLNQL